MKIWRLGYREAKQKAMSIYFRVGRIKCPALDNKYISFNRKGFDHLIHKGRIPRSKIEQKKRFVLLKYIEKIIKNPKATILYREKDIKHKTGKANKHGKNVLVNAKAKYWTFVENINSCKIKLVIVQINSGMKKFCSIMGDNIQLNKCDKTKKFLRKK